MLPTQPARLSIAPTHFVFCSAKYKIKHSLTESNYFFAFIINLLFASIRAIKISPRYDASKILRDISLMKKTFFAIAVLAAASQAQAEEGFFVQGDFGTAHSALAFSENDRYSGNDLTAGFKIGYGFNDNWSVQLQRANAGEFNAVSESENGCTSLGCGTYAYTVDSEAQYSALIGQYQTYVAPEVWSFAFRLGLVFASNTLTEALTFNGTTLSSTDYDDSPVGIVAGIGGQYNFTEQFSFVADLDVVPFSTEATKELADDSADYHVTRVVIGAKYVF